MIYWFIGFILLASLIAGAMWLATASGTVTILWLGHQTIVPIGFAIGFLLLLLLVSAFVTRGLLWLIQAPHHWRQERRNASRQRGMKALTKAFTALASGDLKEAKSEVKTLKQHLDHQALALLVQSQIAHQQGDRGAARHFYNEMISHAETRFLARRGLAREAIQSGHYKTAIDHLRDALEQRPLTLWAWKSLLRLTILEEQWDDAAQILQEKHARKAFPPKKTAPLKAIIAFERAKKSDGEGEEEEASGHLRDALEKDPTLTAAACFLANSQQKNKEQQDARRTIEKAWRAQPHPELYKQYLTLCRHPDEQRLREIEKLTASHPHHQESLLALAFTACDAGLWHQAEDYLQPILDKADERCCLLMIRIKESLGIAEEALFWQEKIAEVPKNPSWRCTSCFESHSDWQAICNNCGAIAAIHWRSPFEEPMGKIKPLLTTKDVFDES